MELEEKITSGVAKVPNEMQNLVDWKIRYIQNTSDYFVHKYSSMLCIPFDTLLIVAKSKIVPSTCAFKQLFMGMQNINSIFQHPEEKWKPIYPIDSKVNEEIWPITRAQCARNFSTNFSITHPISSWHQRFTRFSFEFSSLTFIWCPLLYIITHSDLPFKITNEVKVLILNLVS